MAYRLGWCLTWVAAWGGVPSLASAACSAGVCLASDEEPTASPGDDFSVLQHKSLVSSSWIKPKCDGPVYYDADDQPTVKLSDLPSVLQHSSLVNRPPKKPSDDSPVAKALTSGVVPRGWGDAARAAGVRRVAIVGAGPSGLISAKLLHEEGFEVVVFEASNKVGGQSSTYYSDEGRAYDLATKWVPTYSATGLGTTPLQQAIIEEVAKLGLKMLDSGGSSYFNTETSREMALPPLLQSCSKLKLASDVMFAVNIFEQISLCPGVNGVVECGVAKPDETLKEWIHRNNVECFGSFLALYADSLGAGPALEQHVGYSLKSRSYFLLLELLRNLLAGDVFEQSQIVLPPKGQILQDVAKSPELQAKLLNLSSFTVFEQGYDGFWKLFVQAYALDVRLNERVLEVVPGDKVKVRTPSRSSRFDHVIVAAPPLQSKSFLPQCYKAFWTDVKVSNVEVIAWGPSNNRDNFIANLSEANAGLYPAMCEANLGRCGGLIYDGTVFAINEEFGDGIYLSADLPRKEDWREGAPALHVARQLEALGIDLPNGRYLKRKWAQWPSYVDGPQFGRYFHDVQKLQGKKGLSFVGEVLAGNNVPSIIDATTAFFISGAWLGGGAR